MSGCIGRSKRRRRPPPQRHLAAQQRAFNRFRVVYNEERPHQFLDGRTPASVYRPSPRPYIGRVPAFEYPGHYIPKRVTNAGTIRFKKRMLFLANPLKQLVVGLEEMEEPPRPAGAGGRGVGVWSPANVSRHLQLRLEKLPTEVQALGFVHRECDRPSRFKWQPCCRRWRSRSPRFTRR